MVRHLVKRFKNRKLIYVKKIWTVQEKKEKFVSLTAQLGLTGIVYNTTNKSKQNWQNKMCCDTT